MLQPNDALTVTLTAAEWNQVMTALGDGPFRIVAPLIGKIHEQTLAQANGTGGLAAGQAAGAGERDVSH